MQFSAVIPAIWPMLQFQGGNKDFLGLVTAAYSVGMAISSPLMGIWARYQPVKIPLLLGTITILVGNVMYSFTECFRSGVGPTRKTDRRQSAVIKRLLFFFWKIKRNLAEKAASLKFGCWCLV